MRSEFESWMNANKEDVLSDWQEFVSSMGSVEVYEETKCTMKDAMELKTDEAKNAFKEFCYQSFLDAQ